MSDKKKVIYVKDLVIKADNVTIEPMRSRHRPYDPLFGPYRKEEELEGEEMAEDKKKLDDVEDVEDVEDDDDKDDDDKKRPFSWI